jgi:hypothetical protein
MDHPDPGNKPLATRAVTVDSIKSASPLPSKFVAVERFTRVPCTKVDVEASPRVDELTVKAPGFIVSLIGAPGPLAVRFPAANSDWLSKLSVKVCWAVAIIGTI